jgi:hypothetical protein
MSSSKLQLSIRIKTFKSYILIQGMFPLLVSQQSQQLGNKIMAQTKV